MRLLRKFGFLLLLLSSAPAFAQATGTVRGTVTDPTGAVIPGATITLKGNGPKKTTTSDAAGTYQFKDVAAGDYSLSTNAKGFSAHEQQVTVHVGSQRIDIPLRVEVEQQQVNVESEGTGVSVNPQENASSIVLKGKDLEALSDDPDELQQELEALAGPAAGPNGAQIYIDGFIGGQLPPKSAIREIRVNQNPFSAEYDRLGYGRIEVFTKAGGNHLGGQVMADGNDSAFNSEWSPNAVAQPPYHSEFFEGDINGPMGKNASFFFDAHRRDIDNVSLVDATVLDASLSPMIFTQAISSPLHHTIVTPRFDFNLGADNTMTVRYQYTHNDQKNAGIGLFSIFPSQGADTASTEHTVQLSDTQVISPHVVNESRFEFMHENSHESPFTPLGVTTLVLGAFTSGGSQSGFSSDSQNHYELQNYTSIQHGTHFIKFGGRLRDVDDASDSLAGFNGLFTFPSLTAYRNTLAGVSRQVCDATDPNPAIDCGPSQFSLTTGRPMFHVGLIDIGLYAEDDWRLRRNMTLSYGLRFETQNHIHDRADFGPRISYAWGLGHGTTPKTVIRAGYGIFYDRFAYDLLLEAERLNPAASQKQFIVNQPDFYPNVPSLADLAQFATTSPTYYRVSPHLRAPYTMQAAVSLERALSKKATVSVTYLNSRGEHQFFLRNINAPLPGTFDPTVPGSGVRPESSIFGTANVFEYDSGGIFRENQLITNFRMAIGSKVSLFGFYTLSYAKSDLGVAGSFGEGGGNTFFGAGGALSTPQFLSDPYNPMTDYGRAAFDVRNRGMLGGSISLPRGFRLSPFMLVNSGSPYNITVGQDLYGDDTFNERPALVSSASCPARSFESSNVVCTPLGTFDTTPVQGADVIPINYGTGPAAFTFNLRVSKTFGFGPTTEAKSSDHRPIYRRHEGSGGLGGRGLAGGPAGMMASESSSHRYNLTFSVQARNLFNIVNLGVPVGDINSPDVGRSLALAGGPFGSGNAVRRIDLQTIFTF